MSRKIDRLMKLDWNLLLPIEKYTASTEDEKWYEATLPGDKNNSFPHHYYQTIGRNYNPFRASPYSITNTFDFAEAAVSNEKLGQSSFTDLLAVSISTTDYIGHKFGPNSVEIEDLYYRLDKEIATFLKFLDKQVGKGEYLVFLTADHGAPEIPAFLKEKGYNVGNLHFDSLVAHINAFTMQKYKSNRLIKPKVYNYQVYFDHKEIAAQNIDENKLKAELITLLKKELGVATAFDFKKFDAVILPRQVKDRLAAGYYEGRSGDIQLVYLPQFTEWSNKGTEHGLWNPHDSHIPLLWYGWNVKKGSTNREVYMTDIAATLAAMLHVQMPNGCIGKVIEEVAQ